MNYQMEGHTVHRYDGELSHLHVLLVEMGGLVLDQLNTALGALANKDTKLALYVIDRDDDVDDLEIRTDAEIVSIMARRTPVARDLRTVVACSKAVTTLERIGDEASKLARTVLQLYDGDGSDPSDTLLRDVRKMGSLASRIVQQAMQVLDRLDDELAEEIISGGSELDAEFEDSIRRLATYIMEDSRNVGHAIRIVLATKALERIGDHSRNIAELVIYLIRGEDVRHRRKRTEEPDADRKPYTGSKKDDAA